MSKRAKAKTWLALFERLGKQPLTKTRAKQIVLKKEDGTFVPLVLCYSPDGNDFWLEEDK